MLRTAAASPFSRLPVYRGSRDDIIGILRVKDVVYRFVTDGTEDIAGSTGAARL